MPANASEHRFVTEDLKEALCQEEENISHVLYNSD